jgi:hypothetical protein
MPLYNLQSRISPGAFYLLMNSQASTDTAAGSALEKKGLLIGEDTGTGADGGKKVAGIGAATRGIAGLLDDLTARNK